VFAGAVTKLSAWIIERGVLAFMSQSFRRVRCGVRGATARRRAWRLRSPVVPMTMTCMLPSWETPGESIGMARTFFGEKTTWYASWGLPDIGERLQSAGSAGIGVL